MLAQHAEAHADAPAGSGAIMQCLWSESIGCALNPSYMFAIDAPADSYERCAASAHRGQPPVNGRSSPGHMGGRVHANPWDTASPMRHRMRTRPPPRPHAACSWRSPPCATHASRTPPRRSARMTCAGGARGRRRRAAAAPCTTMMQSKRRAPHGATSAAAVARFSLCCRTLAAAPPPVPHAGCRARSRRSGLGRVHG